VHLGVVSVSTEEFFFLFENENENEFECSTLHVIYHLILYLTQPNLNERSAIRTCGRVAKAGLFHIWVDIFISSLMSCIKYKSKIINEFDNTFS